MEKLAVDQCSSIIKGSIYHTKQISIHLFIMGVDWPEIRCLMEVSVMFDICKYCIFTLYGRLVCLAKMHYKCISKYSLGITLYYKSVKERMWRGWICKWVDTGRRCKHHFIINWCLRLPSHITITTRMLWWCMGWT